LNIFGLLVARHYGTHSIDVMFEPQTTSDHLSLTFQKMLHRTSLGTILGSMMARHFSFGNCDF